MGHLNKYTLATIAKLDTEDIASLRKVAAWTDMKCFSTGQGRNCPVDRMRKVLTERAKTFTYVQEDGRSCPAWEVLHDVKMVLEYIDNNPGITSC